MKYGFLVILIFLIMISQYVSASNPSLKLERSSLIVVPDQYPTIQSAIDNASEGTTIFVKNGTYNERIDITKSLKIYGSDTAPTIIRSSEGGDVVNIRANNVTFARFRIEGDIKTRAGIYIQQSHDNQILDNIVVDSQHGIRIWDSSNITLRNNYMANNSFNFGVWGLFLAHFLHNIDDSNLVEGKPIHYLINEKNKTISSDAGYVAVVNSTDITVKDLKLQKNFDGVIAVYSTSITIQNITSTSNNYGIHFVSSNSNIITQNNIRENYAGFLLDLSNDNDISKNNFSNNQIGLQFSYSPLVPEKRSTGNLVHENNIAGNDDGIQAIGAISNKFCKNEIRANTRSGALLSGSAYNVFCGNTFSENSWGFAVQNSSQNLVFNNNFINNTSQVFHTDNSVNSWNNTRAIGGNYWSNNVILDNDLDGIDDVPYTVNPNNMDNYPLAGIFSNHTFTWDNSEHFITIISNSSEHTFKVFPSESKISLNFTGSSQTLGFCRISIQKELVRKLWGDNFTVLVNGIPPSNMKKWEDDLFIYAYFTYSHPTSQALLIPEFTIKALLASILGSLLVATLIILFMKKKDSVLSNKCEEKKVRL